MNRDNIIKVIKNEDLSVDELAELTWLLNKDQYKERPVTIEQFYSSTDFVAKKWPTIFPLWKQTLKEIFPTPFNAPYNEILISAAAGSGKCLAKDTPIAMYDGSYKLVQNIHTGDVLLGDDGTPRNVSSTCCGIDTMYEVILEDNTKFTCNAAHILSLKNGFTGHVLNINVENYFYNKHNYPEYFAYKYNDNKLYSFNVNRLEQDAYFGFTIDGNHLFVLDNGIVTHNTVTATISVLYDMYKLGCLKDPCSFYGLSPDTMIIMAIFSATGSTAAVNWNDITTGIEACPWMMEKIVDKRGLEKKYGSIVPVEILPGIYIQTGSKFQHSMGKAIFDGLMDEAAFGGSNSKDAQKSYNELSSRMKTRFGTFSNTGVLPGHLFLISSPKEAGDFMQYRIEKTREAGSKLTKVMQNIATWDADPRKDSDEKFTVFIGNENKEPCIYEADDDIPLEEMDYLIYPPMRYYEEFKKDLLISIMNYGGITTTSDMALFKSPTLLNEAFVLNNPFYSDVIELPFAKTDKQLMDFMDLSYFKDIRHPMANRFIHLDAAFSTNTLDVYGFAAGYCIQSDTTTFKNVTNTPTSMEEDVFTKKDRQYFVDFAVGITAPKGQEVPLYKIQDCIEYLIKNLHYPVASISADTFQSKQTLQNLQTKGYETENISVDRTRDPYLFLRHLIHNKQILLPKNEYLKGEMRRLRDNGKKVDHPVGCFTLDTRVFLVDGRNLTIKELLEEQEYKQNWVYTFNEITKKIEPKPIKRVFQTKITKDLIKVTLDNGEVITCTPEHLFMLRDGSYEEIQNLTPGTSLMPLYTKVSNKGLVGYRMYYEPMEDKWHYEHRTFGKPDKINNVIHHCNYNKLDNTPTNLLPVTREKHTTIHNNQTLDYAKVANSVKQWHERIKGTEEEKQMRKVISQKVIQRLTPEQKEKRLQKQQKKQQLINGIETYYNVKYDELDDYTRRSLTSKYIGIIHPDMYKHHSEALKQAHRDGKYVHRKGVPLNRIWVTNGIEDKYIKVDTTIPDGFKPGRCKVGKNHKIVSIERITKPCRVFDLEIVDNHNFALAAGVIVHNSHKDISDSVCGSIWNCANSNNLINRLAVINATMNPQMPVGATYNPQQIKSLEMEEFERIKQQFMRGSFRQLN